MSELKKYYITTPIYYPSGKWHLGHSYTTVSCDALARYKRMQGYDVFYLTGTDEHGKKIEERAAAAGTSPKEFVDGLAAEIIELWKLLDISNNKFIRTTDGYHKEAVSKIFNQLFRQGDIYKNEYEGMYCTPCESFWTASQLKDGKCPDCGREVVKAGEEAYFFRLSKYAKRLEKLLRETDFLQPPSRVNEMINNFIKPGLEDLCVSRSSFKWGIPVSFDKDHVIYVWVDALSNYITALGAFSEDETLMRKYWPCDLHMVGKEIVRFHSIIWPAILMALDLPLPKKVYGHGWLLFGGDKMSKSKGNVVDPFVLCNRYGVDAVRYYLLREIPFGSDGVYTNEALLGRINSDLVNDLSNLVSRSVAMVEQYFSGVTPSPGIRGDIDAELITMAENLYKRVDKEMEALQIPKALEAIFDVVSRANKYIDETAPWKLKDNLPRLGTVLYNLIETIRIVTVLISPFLTKCPEKIFRSIGAPANMQTYDSVKKFGAVKSNKVAKEHIFTRLDINKELKELEAMAGNLNKEVSNNAGAEKTHEDKAGKGGTATPEKKAGTAQDGDIAAKSEITIDDFAKVELRTAKVTACEKIEKADKLLKLTVALGNETRTIVSGIAKYYTPEQMVGRDVVIVANLKPVKLRGIESQGMILCADDGERLSLVAPSEPVDSGSGVK